MEAKKRTPKQVYTISGFPIPHETAVWLYENCKPFGQYPYEEKKE